MIHDGFMDLDLFFDIGPNQSVCEVAADSHDYLFQNYDSRYVQLILSDRVLNCYLAAFERQNMFKFLFNTDQMLNDFGTNKFAITAKQLAIAYPQIAK